MKTLGKLYCPEGVRRAGLNFFSVEYGRCLESILREVAARSVVYDARPEVRRNGVASRRPGDLNLVCALFKTGEPSPGKRGLSQDALKLFDQYNTTMRRRSAEVGRGRDFPEGCHLWETDENHLSLSFSFNMDRLILKQNRIIKAGMYRNLWFIFSHQILSVSLNCK